MSIILKRELNKPNIDLRTKGVDGTVVTIAEMIQSAGIRVYQSDANGGVVKDYTNDLCFYKDGKPSDTLAIVEGANEVKIGIRYGMNQAQDLQMVVTVNLALEPEEEPLPFAFGEDPSFSAPAIAEPEPDLKLVSEDKGAYLFGGDLLFGMNGPATKDHFVLNTNILDLLPEKEQEDLEDIRKVRLEVYPIDITGRLLANLPLVTGADAFELTDDGDIHWDLRLPRPLPFTNKSFSNEGVLGIRYQLSFTAIFKEPETPELTFGDWSQLVASAPSPVTGKVEPEQPAKVNPWDQLGQGSTAIEQTVQQPTPEPEPIETPVAAGWGIPQETTQPANTTAPVDLSGLNTDFSGFGFEPPKPEPTPTVPETGASYPPGVDLGGTLTETERVAGATGPIQVTAPYSAPAVPEPTPGVETGGFTGFDVTSGKTVVMAPPLKGLDLEQEVRPLTPSGSVQVMGDAPVGFQKPHGEGLETNLEKNDSVKTNLDEELAELKGSRGRKKKSFVERIFDPLRKRSKKTGSGKGLVITISAMVLIIGGLGVGGVVYRNQGLSDIKETKTAVEANLKKVDDILKDDQVTAEESVELQKLLTENVATLEKAKSSNFFADLERKSLVTKSNDATKKATSLIEKQTGVTSASSSNSGS